jgi:putative heme-binding domain-containing protein
MSGTSRLYSWVWKGATRSRLDCKTPIAYSQSWLKLIGLVCAAVAGFDLGVRAQEVDRSDWQSKSVVIDGLTFTIPEFCTLEKVTEEGQCKWPIVATFAPDGSLVVAESVWNMQAKETVQQQLISRPHRLVRLRDGDGDGSLETRQVIAEQLSFPEGILCLGNDIYVTAPPQIWKLTDGDGDGVCEKREVWFDGQTLTGCANDLHGPWLGPDGWIYWSKSAFAEQTHSVLLDGILQVPEESDRNWGGLLRGKKAWTSKASHLYRRHPSGGPIDPVMTGGMDNLVDVSWLPNGDRFFCATFLHHPRSGFRDGIGAATYGALFGKPHAVLDGHPRTGPLMEPTAELGPAAPAGLMALGSVIKPGVLDPNFGALVCAQFNLHQVSLHPIHRLEDRSGYRAENIPILRTERIDFHPVDVMLDSDASLLIVDTGGWYDLCCPSSGTDQRVASGGIYRLKGLTDECRSFSEQQRLSGGWMKQRKGQDEQQGFLGFAKLVMQSLQEESQGDRAWLKRRVLTDISDAFARIESPVPKEIRDAYAEAILRGVQDRDESVALLAMHIASLYRIEQGREVAALLLSESNQALVRGAAEWFGRIGIRDEIPQFLEKLRESQADRWTSHSLLYALMEGADPEALRKMWHASQDIADRIALLRVFDAREEIDESHVQGLWDALLSEDSAAVEFSIQAIEQYPKIYRDVFALFERWSMMDVGGMNEEERSMRERQEVVLAQMLARWSDREEVKEWIASRLRSPSAHSQFLGEFLRGMQGKSLPSEWGLLIGQWIGNSDLQEQSRLRSVLRGVKWNGDAGAFSHAVLTSLHQRKATGEMTERELLEWLSMLPRGTQVPSEWESVVLRVISRDLDQEAEQSEDEQSVSQVRDMAELAWEVLPKLTLAGGESRRKLLELVPKVGVVHLPRVLEAYLRGATPEAEAELVQLLDHTPASKSLSLDATLSLLKSLGRSSQEDWKGAFGRWQQPQEDVRQGVEAWLTKLNAGDPRRGYQVFRSAKAACSACHQVGYVGGNVGPNLSKIGQSRSRRDLLEAILYPSARLEQAYQGVKVQTLEGEVIQGLVVAETLTSIELQVSADSRKAVFKSEIAARELSRVSVMPAGLENQLTVEELSDLIAFLENAK